MNFVSSNLFKNDGNKVSPVSRQLNCRGLCDVVLIYTAHAILRRFVTGLTYDEIAKEMKITRDGVRWNTEQLIQKGGFENKHELMATVLCNKYVVTTLMETENE